VQAPPRRLRRQVQRDVDARRACASPPSAAAAAAGGPGNALEREYLVPGFVAGEDEEALRLRLRKPGCVDACRVPVRVVPGERQLQRRGPWLGRDAEL